MAVKKTKPPTSLTIEVASNGWIVRIPGRLPESFHLWHLLVSRLQAELTRDPNTPPEKP